MFGPVSLRVDCSKPQQEQGRLFFWEVVTMVGSQPENKGALDEDLRRRSLDGATRYLQSVGFNADNVSSTAMSDHDAHHSLIAELSATIASSTPEAAMAKRLLSEVRRASPRTAAKFLALLEDPVTPLYDLCVEWNNAGFPVDTLDGVKRDLLAMLKIVTGYDPAAPPLESVDDIWTRLPDGRSDAEDSGFRRILACLLGWGHSRGMMDLWVMEFVIDLLIAAQRSQAGVFETTTSTLSKPVVEGASTAPAFTRKDRLVDKNASLRDAYDELRHDLLPPKKSRKGNFRRAGRITARALAVKTAIDAERTMKWLLDPVEIEWRNGREDGGKDRGWRTEPARRR